MAQAPALLNVIQTYSLTAVVVPARLVAATSPLDSPSVRRRAIAADAARPATDAGEDQDSRQLERIIAQPSTFLEPVAWLDALARVRDRVCRLSFGNRGFATGCLVAPISC